MHFTPQESHPPPAKLKEYFKESLITETLLTNSALPTYREYGYMSLNKRLSQYICLIDAVEVSCLAYLASIQFLPIWASTLSGTANFTADSIVLSILGLSSSHSAGGTSKMSSS